MIKRFFKGKNMRGRLFGLFLLSGLHGYAAQDGLFEIKILRSIAGMESQLVASIQKGFQEIKGKISLLESRIEACHEKIEVCQRDIVDTRVKHEALQATVHQHGSSIADQQSLTAKNVDIFNKNLRALNNNDTKLEDGLKYLQHKITVSAHFSHGNAFLGSCSSSSSSLVEQSSNQRVVATHKVPAGSFVIAQSQGAAEAQGAGTKKKVTRNKRKASETGE